MKITFEPTPGKKNTLTLLIDGEPLHQLHTTIFGKRPKPPKATSETWDGAFALWELQRAKVYALGRLAKKNQPSVELSRALRERLISETTITKIIDECQRLGYINDADWIESFVRVQLSRKKGPDAILNKLRAKGIPLDAAKAALEAFSTPESLRENIQTLLSTKYRSRDLTDYKEKQKVIASLIRKGFAFDDILSSLSD